MFIPIPGSVKKWLAVFRGKVAPAMIILSVLLGFWFGLTPGWTGIHTAVIIIALVVNLHIGLFLIFAGLGKGAAFASAPVLYHTGLFVHEHLGAVVRILDSIPVVAMTDFSKISVAGALLWGPAVGAVIGVLIALVVIGFRKKWVSLHSNSERFNRWYEKKWVRVLDRILIGKSAKDPKATLQGKGPVIRKAGVVLAVLILLLALGAGLFIDDEQVRNIATDKLTKANGAEVNIDTLQFRPLSGKISAGQVQVTDPAEPGKNKLAVDKFTADANIAGFLMGKIVMDDIELMNVKFGEKRSSPGQVVSEPAEKKPPLSDVDAADIEKLVKGAKKFKQMLEKVSEFLPGSKEKQPVKPAQIPEKYLEYLRASTALPREAMFIARRVNFDNVDLEWDVFGNSTMLLKNVSDAPAAEGLPVRVSIDSQDTDASVDVEYDFAARADENNLSGSFGGIDLSRLQSPGALKFAGGSARGRISGTMLANFMDVSIDANIKGLQLASDSGGLMGLDAKTTGDILSKMKDMDLRIRLVGSPKSPQIKLENEQLLEEIKKAAVEAGKQKMLEEVDKQIGEKVGDKVPAEVKDSITEGIKGIFGGEKDQ